MSRRVSNNNKKATLKISTSCHVCEKAGQPKSCFESHNFRDNNGKVCCIPFLNKLRAHMCSCCGKVGNHFSNQCKEPKKQQAIVKYKEELKYKETIKITTVKKSAFSALDYTSDEEEADEPIHPNVTVRSKKTTDKEDPIHPNVTVRPKNKIIISWADCESSDDDDVEEE